MTEEQFETPGTPATPAPAESETRGPRPSYGGGGGRGGRNGGRDDDRGDRRGGGRGRRLMMRRRVCYFCTERVGEPDYKKPEILARFLADRGKIRGRRQSSLCAKHQRRTTRAIKWARELALLPFVTD